MVFAGITFLYRFLPITLIAYFVCPKQFRNGLLFLASLIFYAWGEPIYVLLMLFSTVSDYWHGRMIDQRKQAGDIHGARRFLISSIVINLLLLGFFKYAGWIIGMLNRGFHLGIPELSLALPLGISFYTFQTMSYSIDVYRGEARVQKNIIDFGMFVTMFPQLIAGPIVRYADIEERMKNRPLTVCQVEQGVVRFTIGLAKKVLLANEFGKLWDRIQTVDVSVLPASMGWLGILAYGLQIYYDFSGYSDMAIGLGTIFGFSFPENFRYPYESVSISEFFRRWHMTLQKWFAEYVYYPLGGNRKGLKRQVLNIAVVWALTGIWHGASGNFLVWGLYFAAWLILEKLWLLKIFEKLPMKIGRFLGHIYTLVFVGIGWVFFTHTDLREAFGYIGRLFGNGNFASGAETIYWLREYAVLLIIGVVGATSLPMKLAKTTEKYRNEIINAIFVAFLMLVCTAFLVDASYNPFLYFRF